MDFPGFEPADFDLFAIPDFAGRMGEIRARLRPKLTALGEALAGPLSAAGAIHPHTAQHMRRRVNPPPETWVAFGRDRRGYKRWVHYRVAISGAGVRATVFVEDDADDKPTLAAALADRADDLLAALAPAPVVWYTLDADRPLTGAEVTPAVLAECGRRLGRLKGAKFQAGIPLHRDEAARLGGAALTDWALTQLGALAPLYEAATTPGE
jgi:uncharacterized protein YktB (UPF0637 family)